MKNKNMAFAVLMAAVLNVSASEIDSAYNAFMRDFKQEGRV